MKVALVHDYLNEFGGAERVLEAFCEIWPDAPIYTAFYRKNSPAYKRFKNHKIIASWAQNVPFFAKKLHSPLRFLAPFIWGSFSHRLADYDVVLASSSWFITRGFKKKSTTSTKGTKSTKEFVEISYCHTPPRYLYGYPTSVEWQRFWPVKLYALLVNHFMRVYDFEASQKTDYFIANSREVAGRIKKFYRRDSIVIYPPVDTKKFEILNSKSETNSKSLNPNKSQNYFLVVSRLVAAKKVDIAVEVCAKLKLPLKVVGEGRDFERLSQLAISNSQETNSKQNANTVEFLGGVDDWELIKLYRGARAVIFPAQQEDFGLVPVEAMAAGVPVIANAQGGVLETVIDANKAGKEKGTGIYFSPATAGSLTLAINNFMDLEKKGYFDNKFIQQHAQKFGKERFKKEIKDFVAKKTSA